MRIHALTAAAAASLLLTASANAAVPAVTTGAATAVTQTSVKLTGTVKPNNGNTTWHFEYGTTPTFGTSTPEQGPIASGSAAQTVSVDVTGLTPGTTYYYRAVATNPSGSTWASGKSFTTRPSLSASLSAPVVLFGRSETVAGQVFGSAVGGITVTLQENPYPFDGFADVSTTTTDSAGRYQFIRPVVANTAYRVIAQTKPPGSSGVAFAYEQDAVSVKPSTSRPRRGRSVLFTGFAQPARVGVPVYIQRLGSRGWGTVARATLAPTSVPNSASYAVRLRRVRSGLYRAFVTGGWDHLAGISRSARVTVR